MQGSKKDGENTVQETDGEQKERGKDRRGHGTKEIIKTGTGMEERAFGGLTCYDDDHHGHKMLITKKTATQFPHQVKLDLLACFSYQQG